MKSRDNQVPEQGDEDNSRVASLLTVHGHHRRSDGTYSLYVGSPGADTTDAIEIPFQYLSPRAAGQLGEVLRRHGHLDVFDRHSDKEVASWLIRAARECKFEVIDRPGVHTIKHEGAEAKVLVMHGRSLTLGGEEEVAARVKLVGPVAVAPEAKKTLKRLNRDLAPVFAANPRLLGALYLALAAPLLSLCGRKPLALLIVGQTSKGKSILQRLVLGIVNGIGEVVPLNATRVGLHDYLAEQGEFAVFLEDVHKSNDFGALLDAIMDAGNGGGRIRAKSVSRGSTPPSVRCTLIMSSEFTLADTARRARCRLNGGAYARVFEVHLGEYGVFDDLCERASGGKLAAEMASAERDYRGVLGRAFFEAVTSRWDEVQAAHAKYESRVRQKIAEVALDGELGPLNERVLDGLVFAALAGVVAWQLDILDIAPGKVMRAFKVMFREHLDRMQKSATPVAYEVVEAVRHYLQTNPGRFASLSQANDVSDRQGLSGFRKTGKNGTEYLFFPGTFREVFVKRFGDECYAHLREAGYLGAQESRHNRTTVWLPRRNSEERQRQDFVSIHESILFVEDAG